MELADEIVETSPGGTTEEQAVIICLQFPIGKFRQKKALDAIVDLDAILREVVETSGVGSYNGNEFCEGDEEESVSFYMQGKDAAAIYQEIAPILESLPSLSGFYVIKRYSKIQEEQFSMSS